MSTKPWQGNMHWTNINNTHFYAFQSLPLSREQKRFRQRSLTLDVQILEEQVLQLAGKVALWSQARPTQQNVPSSGSKTGQGHQARSNEAKKHSVHFSERRLLLQSHLAYWAWRALCRKTAFRAQAQVAVSKCSNVLCASIVGFCPTKTSVSPAHARQGPRAWRGASPLPPKWANAKIQATPIDLSKFSETLWVSPPSPPGPLKIFVSHSLKDALVLGFRRSRISTAVAYVLIQPCLPNQLFRIVFKHAPANKIIVCNDSSFAVSTMVFKASLCALVRTLWLKYMLAWWKLPKLRDIIRLWDLLGWCCTLSHLRKAIAATEHQHKRLQQQHEDGMVWEHSVSVALEPRDSNQWLQGQQ